MKNTNTTSITGRYTVLASQDSLGGSYPLGLQLLNTDDLKAAMNCLMENGVGRCSIVDSHDSEQYFKSVGWIKVGTEV